MMKLRNISAGHVSNPVVAKCGGDKALNGPLIFLGSPRLATLPDVFSEEALAQFSDCGRGFPAVPLRCRVLTGCSCP
jgi:hypothetical protein